MDRISALRNVEDALSEFEAGECDLSTMERRVRGVLRTYATEFAEQDAYRASADGEAAAADGVVVLASSPSEARERVADLTGVDRGAVTVERVE